MIRVKDVKKSFGDLIVLRGVSCNFESSKLYGLIGPSGGGKSVLMKSIGQVSSCDDGWIDYGDHNQDKIGLMFQEGALFDSLNVFDNVAFPLVDGKVPTFLLSKDHRKEVHRRVDEILSRVGLSDAALKTPDQLSGGMKRRVSLARALVSKPKLVLLDDPTCGLDPVASSVIMELILELHREYSPTTVIVSHDLRRLLPIVDSVSALFEGRIVFEGNVDQLGECENAALINFVSCRYDLNQSESAA